MEKKPTLYQLIIKLNIVPTGAKITDFRGDEWTYHGIDPTGKVIVSRETRTMKRTFYPDVFHGQVIKEE